MLEERKACWRVDWVEAQIHTEFVKKAFSTKSYNMDILPLWMGQMRVYPMAESDLSPSQNAESV